MNSLELIREALAKECGVDPDRVSDETNLLEDLGLDSLDLLNASFVIESLTGTKLPIEAWIKDEYGEEVSAESWFVVASIRRYIDGKVSSI